LGNQYLSRLKKSVRDAEASLGSAGNCILITQALEGGDVERESTSVIDDYNQAEKVYTAPYLYSLNKCREEAEDNLNSVTKDEYKERFLKAMAEYDTIGDGMKVE
jgi:DNA integrity scanning protein DisA with diadenylate cyclase activity